VLKLTKRCLMTSVIATATLAAGTLMMPTAHADDGWVAVASSPSHEQVDFGYGSDQATAESQVLAQCALLQRASDCLLLASGPDCVAVAWDGDQPIACRGAGQT
jgi:hypothetical protein